MKGRLLCFVAALIWTSSAMALSASDVKQGVRFEQRLGDRLPLQLVLHDSHGAAHPLSDYFGKRPVALMFGYYHCRKLCSTALDSFAHTVAASQISPQKFAFVFVSVDPRETPHDAAVQHAVYAHSFADAGAGDWHFLTADEKTIHSLTQAAGVHYLYDARQDMYAHPAGIVLATPKGQIARYLMGVTIAPTLLSSSVALAAANRVGKRSRPLLLLCYQYDPSTGRYSLQVMRLIEISALVMALILAAVIYIRRQRRAA
jgi:protein SCO1/2